MKTTSEVRAQLTDELGTVAEAVSALTGSGVPGRQAVARRVPGLVAILGRDAPSSSADRVVVDIVTALFGDEAPPGWWATPLGKACAPHSSGVLDLGEAITRADTAAMLGVHPGTVSQLVHRGTLDRHPIHDGVLVGSVVDRINRLSQERTTA